MKNFPGRPILFFFAVPLIAGAAELDVSEKRGINSAFHP
jgi:hypothetical protein